MGPNAMILVFWMLSFKPAFSLSAFTFIKRLFSYSSLSAIMVVSSAYLRLLIFLLANLIPACASSSPAFLMMYSAYKLNKQGDNIQPWRNPFPIWNQSVVPCPVLLLPDVHTDFSGGRSGGLVFPSLEEFSTVYCVIHTVKGFSIVNKAKVFLIFTLAETVKNLPVMQETKVRSLGWEDPLKKEVAIHSRTLAWKIPWMEEPGGL